MVGLHALRRLAVAYALAMGRAGKPPPLISLEAPWSPYKGAKMHAQMRMGKGKGRGRRAAWASTSRP